MSLDFSRTITAEDKAATAQHQREAALKAACRARIEAVLDPRTQANLQVAATLKRLSRDETKVFRAGHDWVSETIGACRAAIASGADPVWPALPEGLQALADRF